MWHNLISHLKIHLDPEFQGMEGSDGGTEGRIRTPVGGQGYLHRQEVVWEN
jgi:hypothetical protein